MYLRYLLSALLLFFCYSSSIASTKLLTSSFSHPNLLEWKSKNFPPFTNNPGLLGKEHLGLIREDVYRAEDLQSAVNNLADAYGFLAFEFSSYRLGSLSTEDFRLLVRQSISSDYSFDGPFILFSPSYNSINQAFELTFWVMWEGFEEVDQYSLAEKEFMIERTQEEIDSNQEGNNSNFLLAEAIGSQYFKRLLDGEIVEWSIQSVRFEGNGNFIRAGEFSDFNITAAFNSEDVQWIKNEKNLPISVARNTTLRVYPTFQGINVETAPTITAKATIKYQRYPELTGVKLAEITGVLELTNTGTYELTPQASLDIPILDEVDFLAPMTITWEILTGTAQNTHPAGLSTHNVYITYLNAAEGSAEEALFFGCTQARNENEQHLVIEKLWRPFKNLSINERLFGPDKQDRVFTYYQEPEPECRTVDIIDGYGSIDGECTAFAAMLEEVFLAQGISTSRQWVESNYSGSSMQDTEYFFVKNWQLGDVNYNDQYYPYFNIPSRIVELTFVGAGGEEIVQLTRENRLPMGHYNWIGHPAVTNLQGIPGQGNPNPYSDFAFHIVVKAENGTIYDPSYGATYSSYRDYEEAAIQAFFKEEVVVIDERDLNLDLNGNGTIESDATYIYLKIRPNSSQNADIKEF